MEINYEKENELIASALNGEYDELLTYISPELEKLAEKFSQTKRGIELEIPIMSLKKASEKHLLTAVDKFNKLDEDTKKKGFIAYYTWFADQGILEYSYQWEIILNGGGTSCCGSCSH